METSPVLTSSVCDNHSRLSLTRHSSTPLHYPRTSKAPHRTVNNQTADCHSSIFSVMRLSVLQCQWLLLLILFTCFFFETSNGLVIKGREPGPNITETPEQIQARKDNERAWFWENSTIPYVFDKNLPLRLKRQSVKAMCTWMKQTNCIKFVERTDEPYFLRFQYNFRDPTCNSFIGKVRYSYLYPPGQEPIGQPIELTFNCYRGKIMHELGHALGFYHEHERLDRDEYVEVDYRFIVDNQFARENFKKRENLNWFQLPYDYGSIMHFPVDAYSTDGNHTLIPLHPYDGVIGQRKRLSHYDRSTVNLLYTCNDTRANRDMLPESPDFIKAGDWIILSPMGSQRQRVECTRNNCSLSECAGKLFKPEDVKRCPRNLIAIRKAPGNDNSDEYIRSDDKVTLTWEQYGIYGPSYAVGGPMYGPTHTETMFCSSNQPCSSAGTCANTTLSSCSERELRVRVDGKRPGALLKHDDVVALVRAIPTPMSSVNYSYYGFNCTRRGSCDLRLLCKGLSFQLCDNLAMRFNLYKY